MTTDTNEHGLTQTDIWNDLVGEAWVRHADLHDQQAQPFGEAAMEAIGSISGAAVLDVGCGTGATTVELAARGAREVLGIDLSAPMIATAQAHYTGAAISFQVGDVLDLRRRDHFDVIYSRFGLMFFDEAVAAFSHLRTLARRDARLGFCCWAGPAANPWMSVPVLATIPVLGPPHFAGPGEPGPFSLSSPDVVGTVLASAGWRSVTIDELSLDRLHPAGDAEAVARVVVEFSPPIAERLAQSPELTNTVIGTVTEALRPHERDGVVHLAASALIVTAAA